MKKLNKAIIKELDKRDWKAFAKGFHELNIEWHAKEWREFIEYIESKQKKEIIEKLFCFCRGRVGEASQEGYFGKCPTCKKIIEDQAIKTIK